MHGDLFRNLHSAGYNASAFVQVVAFCPFPAVAPASSSFVVHDSDAYPAGRGAITHPSISRRGRRAP
eukprot:scaffold169739_cov38-Prasinocladus_malaysianus.AAC.1